ncbi:sensor histidine kinase [Lacrimispora sp. 210928-DFI.3.58]|uniref:sensor histidine kinase n=1 Tax=Lacrimispora sp. 210928-DFI.3.58 TaxID=2883214 RepID=UPI001D05DE4B|nr:HAMP domain-containing sensor histidine kinase [Lacrimispora sp. 210928-DFI.3.58]MCB7320648.1 HAMP domain-containing histidine kinase [Lacrimispora sp. 210928-DFI.3.58]
MKHTLRTQLSLGFSLIVFVTIGLISLTANLMINRRFEKYVEAQQKAFSDNLAAGLGDQYNTYTGEWNLDYIHGFGMYALEDGYILTLYDKEEQVIWDAQNHDMTLCHQIMNRISLRMEEEKPETKGNFVTFRYELKKMGTLIGYADISYYSPYYFNENDFLFIDSLNQILLITGILSLAGAVAAGTLFAKRITRPIAKATELARKISEGNYGMGFECRAGSRELQELIQSLSQMETSLENQERLRRRLTTDMAHELRTPLANVSSHLEAILEGVWEPTEKRLQGCYDELMRISGIVTDLEKMRQIEGENLIFDKEPVDLFKLVRAVRGAFEPELLKKRLTCSICCTSGDVPVPVPGNEKRLHQVVFNLLSNAVKYSNEDGHIFIKLETSHSHVLLTVEDQGTGISKEELPFVFERFYRTDSSRTRKTGGAGIGLAIAKSIVLAHGGKIWAESEEGKGSRFFLSLPREINK